MTLPVAQGFETFLGRLVHLESQRAAPARHRASVEAGDGGKCLLRGHFRPSGSRGKKII